MKLPVRARNAVKSIAIDFANTVPTTMVREWNAALDVESTEQQRDTVEFFESVASKWALYERKERIVRSAQELRARVEQDEKGEVLVAHRFGAMVPEWRNRGVLSVPSHLVQQHRLRLSRRASIAAGPERLRCPAFRELRSSTA